MKISWIIPAIIASFMLNSCAYTIDKNPLITSALLGCAVDDSRVATPSGMQVEVKCNGSGSIQSLSVVFMKKDKCLKVVLDHTIEPMPKNEHIINEQSIMRCLGEKEALNAEIGIDMSEYNLSRVTVGAESLVF